MATTFTINLNNQGGGGQGGGSPGGPGPGAGGSGHPQNPAQAFDSQALAMERLQREQRKQSVDDAYNQLVGKGTKTFDPMAAAQAQLAREQQAKSVKEAYNKLTGQGGVSAQQVGGAVNTVGQAASQLAGGNVAGAGMTALAGLGSASAVLAPIAILAGGIYALNKTIGSLVERGKELAPYSAPISQANAMADIRQILADIREAQTTEDQMAALIDEMSKLSTAAQDAAAPVKGYAAGFLSEFTRGLREFIFGDEDSTDNYDAMGKVLKKSEFGPESIIDRISWEAMGGGNETVSSIAMRTQRTLLNQQLNTPALRGG